MAEIEAESERRGCSKSDVVRERLEHSAGPGPAGTNALAAIADLIGSIDDLPADLSENVDEYLRRTRFGRERDR